jgi:hypothetical protein
MRPPLLYRHRGGGGLVAETVELDLQGVLLVPKMAFKWRSNGVQMAFKWRSNGVRMAFEWRSNGVRMALEWRSNGVQMAFKWRSNGVLIVPELPFELRDVVVVLAGLLCEEILLRMVLIV